MILTKKFISNLKTDCNRTTKNILDIYFDNDIYYRIEITDTEITLIKSIDTNDLIVISYILETKEYNLEYLNNQIRTLYPNLDHMHLLIAYSNLNLGSMDYDVYEDFHTVIKASIK